MAFVRQKDRADCGVAALAMLADVTYDEAWRMFAWKSSQYTHGLSTKNIADAAIALGCGVLLTAKQQLIRLGKKSWGDIPNNSLVKIPNPNREGMWHWVVWRNRKIYDPARGVFKPAKYDGRPTSYMQVIRMKGE